ncbi:aldehyde dehydrogenase domain protein [Mycobacterium xenopi 4042]|uniref:Aldehyde dehydrogenase domain protein n=1 Tax=Mycobacterium xenopi 4042 TaxID=1299334 RepID=X8CMH8_MYCXE|nr:aldehyde dehydrogenase domain protein [Mycobacterium xenopi 4042]
MAAKAAPTVKRVTQELGARAPTSCSTMRNSRTVSAPAWPT